MTSPTSRLALGSLVVFGLACSDQELPSAPVVPGSQAQSAIGTLDLKAVDATEGFIFLFHDCVGPEGTPISFYAVKTELPERAAPAFSQATGYRLTDGSGIFIALIRGNIMHPPGIDASGRATTTCLVDTPLLGTVQFSGFITPGA